MSPATLVNAQTASDEVEQRKSRGRSQESLVIRSYVCVRKKDSRTGNGVTTRDSHFLAGLDEIIWDESGLPTSKKSRATTELVRFVAKGIYDLYQFFN